VGTSVFNTFYVTFLYILHIQTCIYILYIPTFLKCQSLRHRHLYTFYIYRHLYTFYIYRHVYTFYIHSIYILYTFYLHSIYIESTYTDMYIHSIYILYIQTFLKCQCLRHRHFSNVGGGVSQ